MQHSINIFINPCFDVLFVALTKQLLILCAKAMFRMAVFIAQEKRHILNHDIIVYI